MDDVRFLALDDLGYLAISGAIPDSLAEEGEGTTKHAKYAKRGEGRLSVFRL